MALGTTARDPDGLQVAFLERRYLLTEAGGVNGARKLWGTIPKGSQILALYSARKKAAAGGARQIWIGTLSAKSSLAASASIAEGTALAQQILIGASVNFTQDTDLYITQTGMTTTKPTAGTYDFTLAYVVAPAFAATT